MLQVLIWARVLGGVRFPLPREAQFRCIIDNLRNHFISKLHTFLVRAHDTVVCNNLSSAKDIKVRPLNSIDCDLKAGHSFSESATAACVPKSAQFDFVARCKNENLPLIYFANLRARSERKLGQMREISCSR